MIYADAMYNIATNTATIIHTILATFNLFSVLLVHNVSPNHNDHNHHTIAPIPKPLHMLVPSLK